MKFLTMQGLQRFFSNLKTIIPTKTSDIQNDSGFLDTTGVQNYMENGGGYSQSEVNTLLASKADSAHTHSTSDVSGLSTVATSGSYTDLSNTPAIPTKTSELTNDSGFITAQDAYDSSLSSTSENAVQNKVVNAALNGKSDTGHTHAASEVSGLANVATSGSYNDLSNTPAIPTVNNATLTIQKNGSTVKTFTANASSNVTANITVPTNVSDLTNDSGYLTSASSLDSSKLTGTIDIARLPKGALERLVTVANQTARFALTTSDVQLGDTVKQLDTGVMYIVSDESKLSSNDGYTEYTAGSATSVPWSGVSGKPSSFTPSSHTHGSITNDGKLGTASRALVTDSSKKIAVSSVTSTELGYLSGVTSAIQTQLNGKADSGHTHSASDVSGLSTVATTGSYNDLSNKPTIPTVNNATLTIQKNGSTVKTFTANASSNVTANITVPTKTSELTNDSHQTITTDTDTTSAESPAHSGTFTCIDSVTRDSNGHVTKVNTKTITLPSDNNTDTLVAQNYSTANNSYPVVFSNVAGVSSTSNRGNKGTIVNNAIYANPSTGSLFATKLYSGGNEVLTSHQSLSNYSTLANTVKSISISGKTITVTPGSGSAYTLTTQDTVYTHPTTAGNKHIPSGGSSGQFLGWDSAGTAKWVNNPNSDTKVTQTVSTTDSTYPILASATANATATATTTSVFGTGVKLNPSTSTITATTFSGALSGNASTATQFSANTTVSLTGDATGTSAGSKKGWSVPVTLANSGVTAGTYGPSADVTGNNNATISVPEITVDAKGRVTSVTNRTLTCKNNTYNVYNKTLTIQKNGTNVATFTSNSNTDVTANITVPTKTSELTNNSGFLTSHQSLSNYVTLNGAQTISGAKTFTGGVTLSSTAKMTVNHATIVKGTNPSSVQFWQIFNCDKNGANWGTNTLSIIEGALDANGKSSIYFRACKNEANSTASGTLAVVYDSAKNKTWAECPTPDASSNDTKIATTAWVNSKGYLTSHQSLSNYSTLANTVKSLSISGKTITVTPGSGSAYTLTTQDTVYTHPTTAGNKHIPSGGSANQYLKYSASGTAAWATIKTSEITNDSGFIPATRQFSNLTKGTKPSNTVWTTSWITFESSGTEYKNRLGELRSCVDANGTSIYEMLAYSYNTGTADPTAYIGVYSEMNGSIYAKCPTPPASSNDTKIATTAWVNSKGYLTSHQSLSNYVSLNGTQTISGAKTFSGLTKTAGKTEQSSPSDLNDALYNIESYSWGTSTTNKPASSYGILLNLNREGNVHSSTSNGWRAQLGVGTDTRLYLRTKANTGGEWSAWKEFLTSHQSLANYVTLNGAQTISATKTWTKSQSFKNTAITNHKENPTADTEIWACQFWSNDNKYWGGLGHKYLTTGFSEVQLCMSNWTTSGSQGYWHLDFGAAKDFSSVYFRPSGNNNCYLGTSDKKWANVYATTFTGNLTGNVTGNVSGSSGSCTGNAATATQLTKKSITTANYEMNKSDFTNLGYYAVSTFKSGTTSAPAGNNGDYHLISLNNGGNNFNQFLCMTPRRDSLFYGHFWDGTWQGWREVATVDTSQTITGQKIFTTMPAMRNTVFELGATPSINQYAFLEYFDKNAVQTGWIGRVAYTNGYDSITISCANRFTDGAKATNGTRIDTVLEVALSPTGVRYLNTNAGWMSSVYPMTNEGANLGTSTARWNQIYAKAATFSYGLDCGCIELNPSQGRSDGGLIDFHYNQSSADYTSRIIENGSGKLDINGVKFPIGLGKILAQTGSLVKGTNPSAHTWLGLYFNDKTYNESATHRIAAIEPYVGTNGTTGCYMRAYNWKKDDQTAGSIAIHYPLNGTPYTEAPTPATSDNSTKIATTAYVKAQGYLTSHQDLSLYPYKLASKTSSNQHWTVIDLGDTTTYPNGFNDLRDTGKYDVRAVIGTTPNAPSITTANYIQGILEVEWLQTATSVSSYKRIIQKFHRVGPTSAYDIFIRRAYLNSSSVWVWADWEQVVTIEDIPKIVFAYASRSAITNAGNGSYKRVSADSLYYCYFVNGSFTVTSTKVGSSGTYELQSGGVSQTPGTDKICGLWIKIA